MNLMQNVRIEKITLNIGSGKEQARLEKGIALLKTITGIEPIKTVSRKRIPSWGVRPGLPIGCKLTLRKEKANDILKRLLAAKEFKLEPHQFDNLGNLSFGIQEYIDVPGVEYDPDIGAMGFEVCVTFEKPGYRIKRRKLQKRKVPTKQKVKKIEAVELIQKKFNVKIGEKE